MRTLAIILACLPLAVAGQTNTNQPAVTSPAIDWASTLPTNLWAVAYGTYSTSDRHWGGGLALAYEVTPVVATGLRIDYLNGGFYMPSLNLQLQIPVTVYGVTVVPFGIAGAAMPIAGAGPQNGSAIAIMGVGLAVRVYDKPNHRVSVDGILDWERWNGIGNQVRVGIGIGF